MKNDETAEQTIARLTAERDAAREAGAREMRDLIAAIAQEAGGRLTPSEIRAVPLDP